ncbi:hypothetical protein VXN63_02330 [Marinilactibacillus sp. XAAS-LB27]|uniref:hypothetical protein n=1 Tax=Marinilactibacillus sp. XAAS-LB27 TaxID=3114538 RepID=UPI002E16C738|nr:hypothetical protein [Marinilactibacillus sp. XAAS-LB27]
MNQVFVYVNKDGNKKYIGLYELENLEENVRLALAERNLTNPENSCYFIYGNETFELNV